MDAVLANAWSIFGLVLSLLLLCLVPSFLEIFRTIRNFRLISDRVTMLTDIKGWLGFFKKFSSKKRK